MKKKIMTICIIGLMLATTGISVNAIKNEYKTNNIEYQKMNGDIINITVQEAYNMLTNTGDGIQVPIDVRRINEWRPQRIDTPIPENPRWYLLDLLQNESILPKFLYQYSHCDVIFYCKSGGRSYKAAKIVANTSFAGTIYNMLGGITEWNNQGLPTAPGGIYNVTVDQVYNLTHSLVDGIQNPIDVRYDYEWYDGFIDTPWPECPTWYCLDLLKDNITRAEFIDNFIGQEVILYCKGGYRSLVGSYLLLNDNFTGTQYNMLGGFMAWNSSGLPVRFNTAPDDPAIVGKVNGKPDFDYDFEFTTNDAEGDVIYLNISWDDGTYEEWIGPYASGVTVTINHTHAKGQYTVTAQAKDFYGNTSDISELNIKRPRTKALNFNLIEWLFERFAALKQLLGL